MWKLLTAALRLRQPPACWPKQAAARLHRQLACRNTGRLLDARRRGARAQRCPSCVQACPDARARARRQAGRRLSLHRGCAAGLTRLCLPSGITRLCSQLALSRSACRPVGLCTCVQPRCAGVHATGIELELMAIPHHSGQSGLGGLSALNVAHQARARAVDPPWENKSVARGAKYPTLPARRLLRLPIAELLHPVRPALLACGRPGSPLTPHMPNTMHPSAAASSVQALATP
jgi:hypothetical protein